MSLIQRVKSEIKDRHECAQERVYLQERRIPWKVNSKIFDEGTRLDGIFEGIELMYAYAVGFCTKYSKKE